MGLLAAASSEVTLSCWMTEMRLPGKGSSFSAKGLRSWDLSRLGRLAPSHPDSSTVQQSAAVTDPHPLPPNPRLTPIVALSAWGRTAGLFLLLGRLGRRARRRWRGRRGLLRLGQHRHQDARAFRNAGRRIAIAQQPLELLARLIGLARLERRQS